LQHKKILEVILKNVIKKLLDLFSEIMTISPSSAAFGNYINMMMLRTVLLAQA